MIKNKVLSKKEEDAFSFVSAAIDISRAREEQDDLALTAALDENLRLWVWVRTVLEKEGSTFSKDLSSKLLQLSDFVVKKTFEYSQNPTSETLDSFININLQISEGLLESISLSPVEEDAFIFIKSSYDLSEAIDKNDELLIMEALDKNLKLWVAVKTTVKSERCKLPEDIRNNLNTLSEVVVQKTFELSKKIDRKIIESLIAINLQISEGLLEAKPLTKGEEDAFALLKSVMALADAKASGDESDLVKALDDNLKLWVEIRTIAGRKENPLPQDIKDNLILLADFTAQKTFEYNGSMNVKALDALINTNLQICEGLLERIYAS